ncbi:hypothetical protein DMN91_001175 [Ooceraea biroi]|uniref:HAT C-terminal dimerisation domain-containing protein n=1 Tax=Ooceraea biroi TaxID=2015173 RepID=A0A3L8E4H3_OOCBI|nr:uncharacterized protein LOC105283232 isoform X1 [Ooceraea biroi]RLU27373.1 hypothetical protein DMN91_001175 [Ooceraea biroi]
MGVTTHWIDENTFQRHGAVLACKRFKGTHNYIRIANFLYEINVQYNLKSKQIVSTVTDNGKNFVKAFKEFGYKIKIPAALEEEIPIVLEGEIDSEYSNNGQEDLDEYNDEFDIDFEFRSIEQKDTDVESIIELPKHLRCASHTLSLLATTDFTKALKQNPVASKIHHTAMGKCTMLWNMSRRPSTSEKIVDFLGKSLKYPTPTRWNSLFDALSNLLVHRENLNKLMSKLDSNVLFKDVELNYLEECIDVLSSIASALDRLQSENECYYGILMPTLFSLKMRMRMLHERNLRFLNGVVTILITSLENRFKDYFNFSPTVNDAIIASCLHPTFKLKWLPKSMSSEEELRFQNLCNAAIDELVPLEVTSISNSSEDEFFIFNGSNILQQSNTDTELISFFNDKQKTLDTLNKYPRVKKAFIKFNTSLCSAPVERLFSFAGFIHSPTRGLLSDKIFETLVFLKGNKNYQSNNK